MSNCIKVLIAGDFCPCDRVSKMLEKNDFSFFSNIMEVVKNTDYALVNLECPVIETEKAEPIKKCGPSLKTTNNAVSAIKYAGFSGVTLANNHFRDYGNEGCISTITSLKNQKLDFLGGGRNLKEAQKILYKLIKGERFAFVNFCETEFSIASDYDSGSAPLDIIDNYHQILEARGNADFVIVIVHGGHEMYQLPSPRMKKLYRHFISIGADAVINHHQHCYSGYEVYKGKPIVYGLGNFCFDSLSETNHIWNEGYMALLEICNSSIHFVPIPYTQCLDNPVVEIMNQEQNSVFSETVNSLNSIIVDDTQLKQNFDQWIDKVREYKLSLFTSYHNRFLNSAAYHHIIPFIINKKEFAAILDHIECESHRDITISILQDIINE